MLHNNHSIGLSGFESKHQNGVAKREIKKITKLARTMLLHTSIMWSDQADIALWPFTMDHAMHIWNTLPQVDTCLSHTELLTGIYHVDYTKIPPSCLEMSSILN